MLKTVFFLSILGAAFGAITFTGENICTQTSRVLIDGAVVNVTNDDYCQMSYSKMHDSIVSCKAFEGQLMCMCYYHKGQVNYPIETYWCYKDKIANIRPCWFDCPTKYGPPDKSIWNQYGTKS